MIAAARPVSQAAAAPPACELADIVRRYLPAYRQRYGLSRAQAKAAWAIQFCRTAALGGHRDWCPACGFEHDVFHSCRNRHCPKCQSQATAAWVAARRAELLPVPYFHIVFTLPHEVNELILASQRNQRRLLGLLFDAVAQTLLAFGRGELGGKVGFTLVLHTWDQQVRDHLHVHALIASGALSEDGTRWIAGGRRFLFAEGGLSKMFRAKYLEGLEAALGREQLDLPPSWTALREETGRRRWLRRCRKKRWVVHAQAPFAGPRKLIDYLGRYTHRVAISNERLIRGTDGEVAFFYRDRQDGDRRKTLVLPAVEFLRRFLQHVLPDRFQRVRHYGLLANRGKKRRLAHCRHLLGAPAAPPADDRPRTAADWLRQLLGIDVTRCPRCGEPLRSRDLSPACLPGRPEYAPPSPAELELWNTS